jgi:hypothetical protein
MREGNLTAWGREVHRGSSPDPAPPSTPAQVESARVDIAP